MLELTIQTLCEDTIQTIFAVPCYLLGILKNRTQKFRNTGFLVFSLCKSDPMGLVTFCS